jgi:hypothetical protein
MMRVGAAGLAMVLVACGSSAASGPQEKHYPPHVALFGDSLSWESQPYYTDLIHATGEIPLIYDSQGGTAICDWLDRMREVEAQYHPKAVDIQFSGNALTPCMADYVSPSEAYYEKYRTDTLAAINVFAPSGAHIYLIGAPISRSQQESEPNWDALNKQYASIAAADPQHVTYVDAGASVEGPGHTYTDTLPCLPVEPCEGPVVDGVPANVVRAPDGAHFCPVKSADASGVIGGCPVYSSGAYRYANATVQALATSAPAS